MWNEELMKIAAEYDFDYLRAGFDIYSVKTQNGHQAKATEELFHFLLHISYQIPEKLLDRHTCPDFTNWYNL